MKAFRFVFFSILIPLICSLLFVLDGFCASYKTIDSNTFSFWKWNSEYQFFVGASDQVAYTCYSLNGNDVTMYFITTVPNVPYRCIRTSTGGEVAFFVSNVSNYSFVGADGVTYYYTYRNDTFDNATTDFTLISFLSDFSLGGSSSSPENPKEHPLSLHGFTYNLVSNQDYISSVLSSLASVKTDDTEYDFSVGSYTFKWDSVLSDKVTPFESVFVEYGYIKDGTFTSGVSGTSSQLLTKNEFTSYTLPVDLFTFMPTTVSDFVNELLGGKHRAITFTPSYYDSSGTLVFGRTLVFDLIGQNTIGGRPQSGGLNHGGGFSNDTEVMLPDGSSTSVGFGTSTNKFFQFLWDVWPEGGGDTYIDKSDDDKFYINYITNNNGLTIDDINYILDNDKRFGGGTTQVVISPQFDPNGISNNDDLWLGKLRDLYQMILGFNPLMGRIVTAFSSYFIFFPDWVLNFMFTVGSIGLLLGIVKVIRG